MYRLLHVLLDSPLCVTVPRPVEVPVGVPRLTGIPLPLPVATEGRPLWEVAEP
jgi:hypothetical protein